MVNHNITILILFGSRGTPQQIALGEKKSFYSHIGLGLCPIPAGCCKPRDCSSLVRTPITALITFSST